MSKIVMVVLLICSMQICVFAKEEGLDYLTGQYLTENMQKAVSNPMEYGNANRRVPIGHGGMYWTCAICWATVFNAYNGRSGIQPLCYDCSDIFDSQRTLYLHSKPKDCSDEVWWKWRLTQKGL